MFYGMSGCALSSWTYLYLHIKYPMHLSRFKQTSTFNTDFIISPTTTLEESPSIGYIWSVVQREPRCSMRTVMTQLTVAFGKFAKTPIYATHHCNCAWVGTLLGRCLLWAKLRVVSRFHSHVSYFLIAQFTVLGMLAASAYYRHSCPSACILSAPTGRIFVEFDIGDFHWNVSRNSKFDDNHAKISWIYTQT
jgi:hypothetical protein